MHSGSITIIMSITLRAETFAGRNFRVSKKKTRNLWNKLSRFAVFGTNFVEKTLNSQVKFVFFFDWHSIEEIEPSNRTFESKHSIQKQKQLSKKHHL